MQRGLAVVGEHVDLGSALEEEAHQEERDVVLRPVVSQMMEGCAPLLVPEVHQFLVRRAICRCAEKTAHPVPRDLDLRLEESFPEWDQGRSVKPVSFD